MSAGGLIANYYLNHGIISIKQENYEQAIIMLSKSINYSPEDSTYMARGSAYSASQQYDLAIADYSQAISLGSHVSRDAAVYAARGSAYSASQQYDLAIVDYSQAISLEPEEAAVYTARGSAYSGSEK
ncbi:MAG: tetratricopeptide repeat protein, partial [Dehalococcoidales bacterium]|nr:tetratricopeptide repeat protein [Dehalococcoidales bacterium]